ncbi:MAG: 2-phosphoglycerate kinase [Candidatus Altiarchaeota archaeon]|nr:2-phosphoglycerate kinase [Candidatus Altiarchaeota archaeon]
MDFYVRSGESGFPFSRGILAKSILRTGVTHLKAYQVAEDIRKELVETGKEEYSDDEVFELTCKKLDALDPGVAQKYRNWRQITHYRQAIFILIGGGTGVGTTSAAAELGYMLEIPRVIGTDTIREVLRKTISDEFQPTLHESTYNAGGRLNRKLLSGVDLDILGFEEQSASVCVGVKALLERGISENKSMIIEGIHLLPSLIDDSYLSRENVFMFVLDVSDSKEHIERFHRRGKESSRKTSKYVKNFKTIRKIQEYIVEDARKNNIWVIENMNLRNTVNSIADHMREHLVETVKKKN